ncbi:MAG: hypothetical protein MUF30_07115, partial [Burkholderiales bacterium]|nr:hypothetical protein [Burkholderiales bacterium]
MGATALSSPTRHRASTRVAAYLLACITTWASWIPLVQAQTTDIADVPMATQGRVKPNLIFVVDDSGSMDFEVLGAKTNLADTTLPPGYNMSTNDGSLWWNTASRTFIGWGTNADISNPLTPVSPSADVWRGGGTTTPAPDGAGAQFNGTGFSSQLGSEFFADPALPRGPFNFNVGGEGSQNG